MRIVSLVPSVTETLFELGVGDQLVGITRYCILPRDAVNSKEKVGGTKNPDLQKIVQLKPDVVILNMEENRKEDADFLRDQGIELMITYPDTLETSIHTVEELGNRFGAAQKAAAFCDEMRLLLASASRHAALDTLVLIWKNPFMTVNDNTYVAAICRHFGLNNIFGNKRELYPVIRQEEIRTANPGVVLFPDEPYPFRPRDLEEFRQNFPEARAVQENRLLLLNGVYLTWHGYGTLRALRELPAILQPLWTQA